jgi:hypothetical protein
MAALHEAYADYMKVACSDDEIAQSDHPMYRWHDAKVKWLTQLVYGPALAEYVAEWLLDCNEVPPVDEARGQRLMNLRGELESTALNAAHATDVDYDGGCTQETKEAVAQQFRRMNEIVDEMQRVDPDRVRRAETMALAMMHAMTQKAADYGVELRR